MSPASEPAADAGEDARAASSDPKIARNVEAALEDDRSATYTSTPRQQAPDERAGDHHLPRVLAVEEEQRRRHPARQHALRSIEVEAQQRRQRRRPARP